MISNSQFFVLGAVPSSANNLHMYKITFSLTSVNWANQIACPSGTWTASFSESVLSSDGSRIYSFFTFGPTNTYLYFCGLSVSDGSVRTTRYKSSASVSYVWGSALNGDYVVNLKSNMPINWIQLCFFETLNSTIKNYVKFLTWIKV